MNTRKFSFETLICGASKVLEIEVPVEGDAIITNKYCPQLLLTGGISSVAAVNGEGKEEFVEDCRAQCDGMKAADRNATKIDAHIAGLMAAVNAHLARCGRLIFGDLLIYMDCFALLLEADGFSEAEIRNSYPRIARTIVDLYSDLIFNTTDLSPFKGSHFDIILSKLIQ